jgi:hypothetical protein
MIQMPPYWGGFVPAAATYSTVICTSIVDGSLEEEEAMELELLEGDELEELRDELEEDREDTLDEDDACGCMSPQLLQLQDGPSIDGLPPETL